MANVKITIDTSDAIGQKVLELVKSIGVPSAINVEIVETDCDCIEKNDSWYNPINQDGDCESCGKKINYIKKQEPPYLL